jgi:hypothetical protein
MPRVRRAKAEELTAAGNVPHRLPQKDKTGLRPILKAFERGE